MNRKPIKPERVIGFTVRFSESTIDAIRALTNEPIAAWLTGLAHKALREADPAEVARQQKLRNDALLAALEAVQRSEEEKANA